MSFHESSRSQFGVVRHVLDQRHKISTEFLNFREGTMLMSLIASY
jgi:hypothetical protein